MITRLAETTRPLILAHRGASAFAPENTIAAFRLAADQGADGIEFDVRRTADFTLIIHHDASVDGLGPLVNNSFDRVRRHAPHIPTLAEVFDACPELVLDIEIKSWRLDPDWDPEYRAAEAVANLIVRDGIADRAFVSSFDLDAIAAVRAAHPSIVTGWLRDERIVATDLETAVSGGHRVILPRAAHMDDAAALVGAGREHGLWIITWTVDDPVAVQRMAAAGTDGIITNDPAAAIRALGR